MSFREIRGHEHLYRQFAQAAQSGRLGHAYLFVGPEGVGKHTFARALAKTLLCENRQANVFDACGACSACRWFEAQTHPDFHAVALPPEKHEFPIELIHEVIRLLGVKAARGQYRVVLLDDADTLNEESANAFLKTLEEPPPYSVLILLGTSPDYQLPTIRSRCQVVHFRPLPDDVVADWLRQQGLVKSQAEALRIATLAQGSLTRAQLLAQPEVWNARQKLHAMLGAGRTETVELAQTLLSFVEAAGSNTAAQRQRARLAVEFLMEPLRGALARRLGLSDPAETLAHALPKSAALAERMSVPQLLRALDRCLLADFQIDRRLQLPVILEALADSLTLL
ncbi:MAG: DNA polymerase III subunit delta' [Gemmatales bacterium]|nr:DNA polymerase III subunit delta' [Gemmatales bacterium]